MTNYDVVVIGAGSVGVPTSMVLAKEGFKTLCLDGHPSPGQGQNKKAIGGIRATHTQKGKILTCLRSIDILKNWQKKFDYDIEWCEGGYTFVAYTEEDERLFKENVVLQRKLGLNIDWVEPEKLQELVPGITMEGLRGGTYSPEDGNLSPLLLNNAFYQQALHHGAEFKFKEEAVDIKTKDNSVIAVQTKKGTYETKWVINAAGACAKEVAAMVEIDVPVVPDSHEAGITEPVQKFMDPMIVDIRPEVNKRFGNSQNYYFYQNVLGQFIFCLTPDPPIVGKNTAETSNFLPQIAQRMIRLLPRLKNIKVRRTWRGLYPMTPDGSPIVGTVKDLEGYINAVGMCGQGLMLGPGLSELIGRIVAEKLSSEDKEILEEFSLYRDFSSEEVLK
jgi:sarcosine oxidase subunit beta